MWAPRPSVALVCALALAGAGSRADDARRPPDPDPGFLEFLGSVDRLAETNPDYLSSAAPGADPPPEAAGREAAAAPTPASAERSRSKEQ